jgi:hypothetical protein
MDAVNDSGKDGGSATGRDRLDSFLGSVTIFVEQISAEARKAAPEGNQQAMLVATSESLIGQTAKLCTFIRESALRASPTQRAELDRFLAVQDGEAQVQRVVEVTRGVLANGVLGNFLHWLSKHLKELKKILSQILKLLHINIPDWFDAVLLIIDELFDLALSLLSEVFGLDFGRTARELSEQEVSYLRELAAFESMLAARAAGRSLVAEET